MHHTIEMSDRTDHPIIGNILDFLDETLVDPVSGYHSACLFFAGIVFDDCPDADWVAL
jgi:hypothetical protein